ncbi:MAG TPA: YlmC/YmxH family sporulation protein [Thermaerobacter sp.]
MRWCQLAGKEIIDITHARRLGRVADADLVFDPATGQVVELRLAGPPRPFWRGGRRILVVPWSAIRRIGDDLVLVELPPAPPSRGARGEAAH